MDPAAGRKTEEKLALAGYRVLDLADQNGLLCGRILGDLGADVTKIERPSGDPARNIGPFYKDIPHPEKSLYWFAFNANKRGITLNIETPDGRGMFADLVSRADFVVESFTPGYMESLGLGYEALSQMNPRIILTSISPYGHDGPHAGYVSSDLTLWAMGGQLYQSGDPDRPPVWVSFPQAAMSAGAEGAAASMIAHWHREMAGEGQHVDVSAQQCVIWTLLNTPMHWDAERTDYSREGFTVHWPYSTQKLGFACADGHVAVFILAAASAGQAASTRALVNWMAEEGAAPQWLIDLDWIRAYDSQKVTQELTDKVEEPIMKFFLTKTKRELFEQGMKRGIRIAPVCDVKDIAESEQLRARDFWMKVHHPELEDTITYPGAFTKLSETPAGIRRRAPLIGEHNLEVYEGELGYSRDNLVLLKQGGII